MAPELNIVVFPAMAFGVLAVAIGWIVSQPVFFMGRFPILPILAMLIMTPLLAVAAYVLPFFVSQGKQVGISETFTDLMLFGAFPLVIIALVAYFIDHVTASPLMLMLAGSACFAIAALPVAYYFTADEMHKEFEITPTAEEDLPPIPVDSFGSPTASAILPQHHSCWGFDNNGSTYAVLAARPAGDAGDDCDTVLEQTSTVRS